MNISTLFNNSPLENYILGLSETDLAGLCISLCLGESIDEAIAFVEEGANDFLCIIEPEQVQNLTEYLYDAMHAESEVAHLRINTNLTPLDNAHIWAYYKHLSDIVEAA